MGANDSSWQGIGNREAKSTAAAKNSIHIPESAYANLANILIGDSRAQAALGIFRDSGRESNIGAQINNRCGPSQAPAGVHSGRPFRSSQKEENIVSESDDEVVEVQHSVTVPSHKRKRSATPSYHGRPRFSRPFLDGKRSKTSPSGNSSSDIDEDWHSESFAVNLARDLWPFPTQLPVDEGPWDKKLLGDTAQSKRLIADRLVRNPKQASDSVKRAGMDHYLWRIYHRVPGGSADPRHYPSMEKYIQGTVSRRCHRTDHTFPPLKVSATSLRDIIRAQRHGRELFDAEHNESRLHLRSRLRTSGTAAVIEQRGPHETIIASSAIKGTPDMIPDPKADESTIDPRSENVIGSVMYKKTSPSRLSSFGYLDDAAGHALGSSELSWEALRTHFKKAKVTTVEVADIPRTQVSSSSTDCIPHQQTTINRHSYDHYLSCTDSKFVPNSHQSNNGISEFLTAAQDCTVRLWSPRVALGAWFEENESDGHQARMVWGESTYDTSKMGATPIQIHFDPSPLSGSSPLFVVTCSQSGTVHLHSLFEHLARVAISPTARPTHGFDTYACWGRGASAGWVFAGTDPSQDQQTGCQTLRFDTRSGDMTGANLDGRWQPEAFPLEKDFCQFLTTDSIGQRLAVVANDNTSGDLMLRIYDLRAPLASQSSLSLQCNLDAIDRSSRPRSQSPALPPSCRKTPLSDGRSSPLGEEDEYPSRGASVAAFSPDDTYIAIGRENNVAQVLDSRFVRKEIFVCRHSGGNVEGGGMDADGPRFGITALDWIDAAAGPNRSKNVLVTGGDDGAVRMWDLRRAIEDSGQNILPKDPDHQLAGIGAFNLGNVYEGESALIVGDCVGVVEEYADFSVSN